MGRRKATELGRFNALCRKHGVTYGQGVAMGLKLPEKRRKPVVVKADVVPEVCFDCGLFAELYNAGKKWTEIAKELGVSEKVVHNWAYAMGLPSNWKCGGKTRVENPPVTPEEIRKKAISAGIGKRQKVYLDCVKFATAYNAGCSNGEIGEETGASKTMVIRWLDKLGLKGNRTHGSNEPVKNAPVTPEQVYERAKAAGIPVVERSAAGEQTKVPLVGLCEECNPGVSGVEGTAVRNT